jgi:mono/diheme cytochrome c family protein
MRHGFPSYWARNFIQFALRLVNPKAVRQGAAGPQLFVWLILSASISPAAGNDSVPSGLSGAQILERYCRSCHNSSLKQGKLDLTTREALLQGGQSGPAIVVGNAKASLLLQLVSHEQEPGMPYKADKLPDELTARISAWIDAGAPFDSSTPSISRLDQIQGNSSGSDAGAKLFAERVRPILESQCLTCHGGKLKQAGLSMVTRDLLLRGSDNGPVIIAGSAKESLLVKKIKHEHDPGMPYNGKKLSDEVIADIVAWINAGAVYDQPLNIEAATRQGNAERPGSDHWAFKRPQRAPVPVVKNSSWVRNPIDAFVAAEQEKRGLKPVPTADKAILLRRVYLDLVGLPPSAEETQAFLADRSSDAYEKVVDRLLESPRYGERWGRHWMDVWRYSDWYGFGDEVRNSQPQIWNWRDWIIESLNQDKGYDQMIVEMLAGDEIAPTDPKTLRATGYLARNWYRFNRHVWLQDLAEHTANGFLAITLKCARCHDHKFDPIAQEEYYRFRAFFEPYDVRMDRVPGQPDLRESHGVFTNGLPRAYDAEPRDATTVTPFLPAIYKDTYRFIRGDEKNPDREHPLSPGVPEILGNHGIQIQPVDLPIEAAYPDLRPFVHQDLVAQARSQIEKSKNAFAKANQELARARDRASGVATPERDIGGQGISAANPTPTLDPLPSQNPSVKNSFSESGPGVGFEKEIKPILEKNCFSCHNSNNEKSGLVLETVESIRQGGNTNGPAVIPRKSGESPLVQYLRGEKTPRMPFGGRPLPEQQIALITQWIDQLPEDEPQLALQKAEAALALAQKELAAAEAYLPALEARFAADKAKYAEPPDPSAETLAQAARRVERQANLLKGEENLLRAQQKLAEALRVGAPADEKAEKAREKQVEVARKQLDAAVAALSQASDHYTPIGKLYPKSSTGRRLALARWIANKQNPLTARVAVNHMWLRHFGKALVPTVANFGRNGRPPTHPELLDWLANEFMDMNWSMKSLHRLMVTSNTYRMASSAPEAKSPNLAIDPDNRYLWRMNPHRMEAEVVRDSLLQLAGQLDVTMGGPEIDDKEGQTSRRRSVYFKHTPDAQMVFLKVFDAASPTDCYERNESVVPQQALALSNSPLSYSEARRLARILSSASRTSGSGESEFIVSAFQKVLSRPPSAQELSESVGFMQEQCQLFQSPEKLTAFRTGPAGEVAPAADPILRARESLVHALFNHNDFVTIR